MIYARAYKDAEGTKWNQCYKETKPSFSENTVSYGIKGSENESEKTKSNCFQLNDMEDDEYEAIKCYCEYASKLFNDSKESLINRANVLLVANSLILGGCFLILQT